MIAIKFDKEKVENCINAYKEEHGKLPYLIMSSKTKKLLPINNVQSIQTSFTFIAVPDHGIDDKECVDKWHECKILIDDDLDYGEILI